MRLALAGDAMLGRGVAEAIARTRRPPLDPEVMAVASNPEGRLVASAHRDSAIRLWSLPGGREVTRLPSPAATTYAVVFSRDGRFLYSGGDDRAIHKWDIARVLSVAR